MVSISGSIGEDLHLHQNESDARSSCWGCCHHLGNACMSKQRQITFKDEATLPPWSFRMREFALMCLLTPSKKIHIIYILLIIPQATWAAARSKGQTMAGTIGQNAKLKANASKTVWHPHMRLRNRIWCRTENEPTVQLMPSYGATGNAPPKPLQQRRRANASTWLAQV